MGYIVEYTLANPILETTRRSVPDVELEVEDEQPISEENARLIFWARGSEADLQRFEEELPTDPSITDYEFFSDISERRLFRVTLSEVGERGLTYVDAIDMGITFLEILAKGDHVEYRAQIPDRDALVEYRKLCEDHDLSFELRRLYRSDDGDTAGYDLTDRQREVLLRALEQGYYEVPREISTEELAAEFDISSQALSALLRRGHEALLRSTVAKDGHN
ncbi:helix-turn-helix domain-containing protein [Halorientalis brevis]|uniref:Helix-turn-helix domain-containing protein n=1 Tax=Halorientalis brevis TaxID=1126241 RepID=A0ABD6CG30_9EURY|nr:helix-turn-helix domain-containing protein [Halorientalis brevis]